MSNSHDPRMTLPERFEDKGGELFIDGVSALQLANEFDTPLFVTSENRVRQNYRHVKNALIRNYPRIRIYFSAKSNTSISILRILEREGACVDVVSPGEVFMALRTGFSPDRILFTGTSVRDDELMSMVKSEVLVNVDSISQLHRLLRIAVPERLSVRINPEIGAGHHNHCITAGRNSKFGLLEKDAINAYSEAKSAGVKQFSIHMHIGSGILDTEPFALATDRLLGITKRIKEQIDIDFESVNMGGGLGVPYRPEEKALDLEMFSDRILTLFRKRIQEYGLGEPCFCIEPGRYIVCDAGILLTRVNTVKVTPFKKFVGVDAGFNTLVRPTMYGSYHSIVLTNRLDSREEEEYDVVGPICESGDNLAKGRRLPRIEEGDVLAVLNVGAYGFSMSSQYNLRPRAAEVLVNNGKYALVREREDLNDLLAHQRIAQWLE